MVTELAVEPIRADAEDSLVDARYAGALLARIRELDVMRRIATLKGRFQRVNPSNNPTTTTASSGSSSPSRRCGDNFESKASASSEHTQLR